MEFDVATLPTDWQVKAIREVTVSTSYRDPGKQPDKTFHYVDVSSVDNTLFKVTNTSELKGLEAPSRARKDIRTNDVIFATVRPTLRRIALIPPELDGAIASTGYCVLRSDKEKVVPRFLYAWLLTDWFVKTIGTLERGANYPAVRDSDVFTANIPLPSLDEQRKIAAVLSQVQRAIEQQERLIALTTELKKTLLHQLFTQGLRGEPQKETEIGLVPESWEVRRLEDVALFKSGGTPSRIKSEYWKDGWIPWVKTGEVDYCEIRDTEEKITATGLANSSAKRFPPGTLLMAMYGQGITRGKVAILGIEAATNQACVAIFPKDEIRTNFLYYFFEHNYEYIRNLGHGANQKNLSAEILKGVTVAYPKNTGEQDMVVGSLKVLNQKLSIIRRKQRLLTDLFRSLLHQLMTAQIRVDNLELTGL